MKTKILILIIILTKLTLHSQKGSDYSKYDTVIILEISKNVNSSIQKWSIPTQFDSIDLKAQYLYCFSKDLSQLDNKQIVKKLKLSNVIDYHVYCDFIQILIENDIKYVGNNLDIVDSYIMKHVPTMECGFNLGVFSKIIKSGLTYYIETYREKEDLSSFNIETLTSKMDTILISKTEIGEYDGELTFTNNLKTVSAEKANGYLIVRGEKLQILDQP